MANHISESDSHLPDDSPLVSSAATRLSAIIQSRRWRAGESLPAERSLASELLVSRFVIRSAIRRLCAEGLIELKPNCRPVIRPQNSNRRTVKRPNVGIWIWPNMSDFAASAILRGIRESPLGETARLVIGNASFGDWDGVNEAERKFLDSLAEDENAGGAIIWYLGGEENVPALIRLREMGVTTVFIDRAPPKLFPADFVGTSNFRAAGNGVRSLIQQGHRRIALITNADRASSVRDREDGYRQAIISSGLPVDPELIFRDSIDEAIGVEQILDRLLKLPNRPTAIFCINDHLALQAYDALALRGIKVPDAISLVGFDGLLRWIPGGGYLTTLCQDFEQMGRLAAELVQDRMTGVISGAYVHYLLDATLLDCGSTKSPAPTAKEHCE